MTIGACATAGGVQALRNFTSVEQLARAVYPRPELLDSLATSTPIPDHVPVDFELRGCPVDRHQLLEVITAFLHRRRPVVPAHSVCLECKPRGNPCVMVAHGVPCLGPVTQAAHFTGRETAAAWLGLSAHGRDAGRRLVLVAGQQLRVPALPEYAA